MTTEEKISAKGAAHRMGVDARAVRKFLRSDASPFDSVGQGHRYEFTEKEFLKLKRKFKKWASKGQPATIEVDNKPAPDIEELEVDGPEETIS